jgi:uncharacterized repeat protein (TIGR01451 family)
MALGWSLPAPAQDFPAILIQPTNQVALQGDTVREQVTASGAEPLQFQWFLNDEAVTGATNASLILTNVQSAQAGIYVVAVSNDFGSVLSDEATLTVLVPPGILTQPNSRTIVQNNNVIFGVTAIGTAPFHYQWRKDGLDLEGQTNATLSLPKVQPFHAGAYTVLVSNQAGSILSEPATLTVLERVSLLSQPVSLTVTQGNTAVFMVTASGEPLLRYLWFQNETNLLAGQTNATLTLTDVQSADAGTYQVVVTNLFSSAVSEPVTLTVLVPPTIDVQPSDQAVALGASADFAVVARGDAPLTYQWQFEGGNREGETNATLLVENVGLPVTGEYRVVLSNYLGVTISSPARLSIEEPPVILTQPVSLTLTNGDTAFMDVAVSGTPPLSYQWFFNQTRLIEGATNAQIVLTNVGVFEEGTYRVLVTNHAGSTLSSEATLTVLAPPFLLAGPLDTVATNQNPAALSVTVAGTPPFQYQWYFNDAEPIAAATNATLLIPNVSPAEAGRYRVEVANDFGSVLSGFAQLAVVTEDFGDAPSAPYPTRRADNGARHLLVSGLRLGLEADSEDDGQDNAQATGDDFSGRDDEDGVVFLTPLFRGQAVRLAVVASSNGLLSAWLDFNGNGNWSNPGEQIFTNLALLPGTNELSVNVPLSVPSIDTFARFRFSSAGGLSFDGPAPDGEVEDYLVTLRPAVDLAVGLTGTPDPVTPGNTISYTASVTNLGPDSATGVVLENALPPDTAFVSAVPSQGTCDNSGGVIHCSLGALNADGRATVTLVLRPAAAGTLTNRVTVRADQLEAQSANNTAQTTTAVSFSVPAFSNGDVIFFPEYDNGPASPYPSTINVSGLTATVYKVTVTLQGVTHTFPDDIDIMLVGPQGQSVILMSDCGNGQVTPIDNVSLTFDDAASQFLPDFDQIVSGTYRPTNYGSGDDIFVAPSPAHPSGTTLSVFNGTNPNGAWRLFVMDDLPEDTGFITDGWRIRFTLLDPFSDLAAGLVDVPDPASVTSNLTYTVTVTNLGPARATGVAVLDALPAGLEFVSGLSSQGGCSLENGIVRCDLGTLEPNAVGTASLVVRPQAGGFVTNAVAVSSLQVDFNSTNNTAFTSTRVLLINDLALNARAAPEPALLGQDISCILAVTNLGPYDASGVAVTNVLPAGFTFLSAVSSQGTCSNVAGTVHCDLGSLVAGAGAEVLIMIRPNQFGVVTNRASVGSAQTDLAASNNVVSVVSTVLPAANLVLTQTDGPDPLVVSEDLTYSLVVSNSGPSQATGVVVADALPSSLALLSAVASQGACTNDNGVVRCDLGSLDAGGSALIVLEAHTLLASVITNAPTVSSTLPDPDPVNNTSQEETVVAPAADLALYQTDSPDPVLVGEPLSYTVTVTNLGPNEATGVRLMDTLPAAGNLISATTSQGVCTNAGGIVSCDLGSLPALGAATVTVVLAPTTTGAITNLAQVEAAEADLVPDNNRGEEVTTVLIDTGVFSNGEPMVIPEAGPASLYPSSIFVSGVTVKVDSVSVTLNNVNHTYAGDLDVLLVSPDGQAVLLMSDVGGDSLFTGQTFTFNDDANRSLPPFGPFISGSYRPTDYGTGPDEFPEPAPPPPYQNDLSGFKNVDPNGTWSLYVLDDAAKDSGSILGGWSLQFATLELLADLTASLAANPSPVSIGSNLTYTVTVTNRGPSAASGVLLTNVLPAGVDLISIQSSQGACAADQGVVGCDLGDLMAKAKATVTVEVLVQTLDPLQSTVVVTGREIDVRPSNNSDVILTEVHEPPVITEPPASLTVTNGQPAMLSVAASGTDPLAYQWFRDGTALAGETNNTFTLGNAQGNQSGLYTVQVRNDVGAVSSDPAELIVIDPVAIVQNPSSQMVAAGGVARLQVAATGSEPRGYQWFYEGAALPGQNGASLVIPNVQTAKAGRYQVMVSNILNTVTSAEAVLSVVELDYGDAPAPPYPTLHAGNGARHLVVPGVHLGERIDFEPDGQPDSLAEGDDLNGLSDDDGVAFLNSLVPGKSAAVRVVASTNGFLNAWVDFNADGSWAGNLEQIFTNVALLPGTNTLAFDVPATALDAENSYARFRFSTVGGLGFAGEAPDGEVEDYHVAIRREADLNLQVRHFPDPVTVNFNLVYEIAVTNAGPLTAPNVFVRSRLPGGAQLLSVSPTQGSFTVVSGEVLCQMGNLAVGQGASITIVVLSLTQGTLQNSTTVSSSVADPNPADNSVQVSNVSIEPPRILVQPPNLSAGEGNPVAFNVGAAGTALLFQWQFNGGDIPGATNANFLIPQVQMSDAGVYTVSISNVLGGAISQPATLTVLVPPAFTLQPQSQTVAYGDTVTFTALAEGSPAIGYQWQFNGTLLAGERNSTLTVSNAQPSQAGQYAVVAKNPGGLAVSVPATLQFAGPPLVALQPVGRTNTAGSTAVFTTVVTGTEPLSAQWYFNGTSRLDGETNLTLVLNDVQKTNSGTYHLVVTNLAGTVTSDTVVLSVVETDFGDAPDPARPTLLSSNGARHRVVAGVHLGSAIDFEPDGLPDPEALGDDLNGVNDDDGVRFLNDWLGGQIAMVEVVASTNGFLNAWADFNGNGSWAEAGDYIFRNVPLAAGTNLLNVSVPATATARSTFARFRFNTTGNLSYVGEALDGEVEDYALTIQLEAELAVRLTASPEPVAVGGNLLYTLVVTNRGPASATDTVLTDLLPADLILDSITASQGVCSNDNGTVTCQLGEVRPGFTATVTLRGRPTVAELMANLALVTAREYDLAPNDDFAQIQTSVQEPVAIVGQPENVLDRTGATVPLTVLVAGEPPLTYQWEFNGTLLAGQTNASLLLVNLRSVDAGSYRVRVANPFGSVWSEPALVTVLTSPSVQTLPPSNLTGTRATLNALVNPHGLETAAWFEWGETLDYGNVTPAVSLGSGAVILPHAFVLNGLAPGVTYHYRVLATNQVGSAEGADQSFTLELTGPEITLLVRRADGTVRLEFAGSDGLTYEVRASSDLQGWTTLGNGHPLGDGLFEYIDDTALDSPVRFYQILQP